ncbi:hypothetical protein FAM22021_002199 [Propionibacterium freudenreichii]|nr:hypothetical protein [Propionibacterium freudenreichii]
MTRSASRRPQVGRCGQHRDGIIEAINDPAGYDVLAVELSSFQLHWFGIPELLYSARAALNLHADHLEWYSYAGDNRRVLHAVGYAGAD